MRMKYTFSFLAGALLCAAPLQAQISLDLLSTPDSLQVDMMGDPTAEDYGAVPYGKSHVLFSSNRDATALTPKDPETNKPLPSLYLMRLSDRKVTAYKGNEAINDLKYYVGPAALLPDSSAIIMNHSRQKPDGKGNVRMTLSQFSFSGAANSELPFIDPAANYVHPFFDEESYTLYFASDVEHAGNYDIYQSTLSFDGVWSQPSAVANVNTEASEVFPTLLPGQIMAFSRATRNYGLQLHTIAPGPQRDGHRRSHIHLTLHFHTTTPRPNHTLYDCEAQPRPLRSGAELRLEDPWQDILRNPSSVIDDLERDRIREDATTSRNHDRCPGLTRKPCVLEKIDEDLLELGRSRHDGRKIQLEVPREPYAGRRATVEHHDLVDHLAERDRGERYVLRTRRPEPGEGLRDLREAIDLAKHGVHIAD